MSGLPLALQLLVWAYGVLAVGAVLGCAWTMYAGLATGRHRRRKSASLVGFLVWLGAAVERFVGRPLERALVDIGQGITNGFEVLFYGRSA